MSLRLVYHDESSDKLLIDSPPDEDEDEDDSLTRLLGITEKDVVNLDDDGNTKDNVDDKECLREECEKEAYEHGDSDNEKENVRENANEHNDHLNDNDIEADDKKDENDVVEDSSNDSGDDEKEDKKIDSNLDFKKLFGLDLDSSINKGGATPGSSIGGSRIHIGDGYDNWEDSAKSRVFIPPEQTKGGSTRPVPGVIQDRRKMERTILKKQVSQKGKLLCGMVIVVILLCMAAGLVFLGWWYNIGDLYIVGGIFGGGAVVFFVLFVFIRCTTIPVDYVTIHSRDSPL